MFPDQPPQSGQYHSKVSMSDGRFSMGRGILLWFLGIPIPIIILIMLFVR
jgi:hypothetical protein